MKNNIREDKVSYHVAKLLQEKGFCIMSNECWLKTLSGDIIHSSERKSGIEHDRCELDCWQPTQALAVKWIRVNFGIHIIVAPRFYSDGSIWFAYEIIDIAKNSMETLNNNLFQGVFDMFETSEKVIEEALEYTLTKLIN